MVIFCFKQTEPITKQATIVPISNQLCQTEWTTHRDDRRTIVKSCPEFGIKLFLEVAEFPYFPNSIV